MAEAPGKLQGLRKRKIHGIKSNWELEIVACALIRCAVRGDAHVEDRWIRNN